MKLITLLENRTESKKLKSKHGLSYYIEVNGIKLIFDTGPDNTFLSNAKELGIDVTDIDFLIISHGHIDHGGGIESFIRMNSKGKIIISKYAFDKYYTQVLKVLKFNIGLNEILKNNKRIELIDGVVNMNNGILFFDGVVPNKLFPKSNEKLLCKTESGFVKDDFKHEINLMLSEGDKKILISGCSHKGIVNIIEHAERLIETNINVVIGGMHLYNPITKRYESKAFIRELSNVLSKKEIDKYYTCHCTGERAYKMLKNQLKNKIDDLKTGSVIVV
jgi:7,8-dihydropterin-6-yl-methyl-4-(beta-D-ribofuranosyl)aminobenzene 5'-phosphate synthase